MNLVSGRSSQILKSLLGDTSKYTAIMDIWSWKLQKKYPSIYLKPIFLSLGHRLIALAPMVLFDSLLSDLKVKSDEKILTVIGLSCLPIATHDDVVDETLNSKTYLSSLIFSGNISAMEGAKLLLRIDKKVASSIIDSIAQNHYLQQLGTEKLWQGKMVTKTQYLDGRKDVHALAKIGLVGALKVAGRDDLIGRIEQFARGYGIALQLIDDIREVNEDRLTDYRSLPLMEPYPYKKSFIQLNKHIQIAKDSLKADWKKMRRLVDNVARFAKRLRKELLSSQTVAVATAIIIDKQGMLLLLKRSNKNKSNKGLWQLVEGKVKVGEKAQDALIREVNEETGLIVCEIRFFGINSTIIKMNSKNYNLVRSVFKTEYKGEVKLSSEHSDFKWISPKEALSLPIISGTDEILKLLKK